MNCTVCSKPIDSHLEGRDLEAVKRFLSKLSNDVSGEECWNWQGSFLKPNSYGQFYFKGKTRLAHRVSVCLLLNMPVPPDKMVMHLCHNRQCVNPNHLKFGTAKENSDMDVERGHAGAIYNKGEAHPKARLTEKDIKWIHSLKGQCS